MKETYDNSIYMSPPLLSIIIAVQAFKEYIIADYIAKNGFEACANFDWYLHTSKYFQTLELPAGLKHNKIVFDAIIKYPQARISIMKNMDETELSNFKFIF